jgi:hypothetical protein
MELTLLPSVFIGRNMIGDFAWMIKLPEFDDCLFVFNDDVEHVTSYEKGWGNAVIRPYSRNNPDTITPRAAGIPTGSRRAGGFQSLNPEVKSIIDTAVADIGNLIREHKYTRLVYSANPDGTLGTGLFKVGKDVKSYILGSLTGLLDTIVTLLHH